MKHPGPLFTLLAGVVLAVGIGVANAATPTATSGSASAASTSAPPPPPPPPPATTTAPSSASIAKPNPVPARADYVGRVDGGGASVAVSVRDGHAIAYVCDGKKVEAWLQGITTDGQLDLKDAKGGTLVAKYDPATVTGTVTAGGKTWHFTAPAGKKPAGLYRATPSVRGKAAKVGWIVQPDGSQVGLLTTDGTSAEAPPLDPAASSATVDGTPVKAEAITGLSGEGEF